MDPPLHKDKLEDIGEAIQLASQADLAAMKEDDNLKQFEDLFRQLQIQKRLMLEGDVRKRKIQHLEENENIPGDFQVLKDKILLESVKSEESLHVHLVCQKALEVCQFSLSLQSTVEQNDLTREKHEEELLKSSVEYMLTCIENLDLENNLKSVDNELQEVQNKIKQVQVDTAKMKNNPEVTAGQTTSQRIEKLEVQLDKSCGRYNFTRYLTQLLLLSSEKDIYGNPKISELFLKCGISAD